MTETTSTSIFIQGSIKNVGLGGGILEKVKNRWLIAASALGIHLSIGSAYAWSVFTNPLADEFGWSTTEISMAFSIAIFFLGTSAAFMGRFVENRGPRTSGMVAAIFFGVGVAGSGLGFRMSNNTRITSTSVFILRCYWRNWFRNWLYFASFHASQMVSRQTRTCNRISHYGIWFCRTN